MEYGRNLKVRKSRRPDSNGGADRLRAMEQLENRALGRPAERVQTVANEIDELMDQYTLDELIVQLVQLRGLPQARKTCKSSGARQ